MLLSVHSSADIQTNAQILMKPLDMSYLLRDLMNVCLTLIKDALSS